MEQTRAAMTGLADRQDEYRRRRVTFASDAKNRAVAPAPAPAAYTSLFAAVGLSGVLRPAAAGSTRHGPRAALRALCWLMIGLQTAQAVRTLRARDRGPELLVIDATSVTNGLLCAYKGLVLTGHADSVRKVLRVAGPRFTRSSRRRPREMLRCAAQLSAWLYAFAALAVPTVGLWVAVEWYAVAADPSSSDAANRAVRYAWAASQSISLSGFAYSATLFDFCMGAACFGLDAQFRTVSASCETVGHPPAAATVAAASSSSTENNCDDSVKKRFENYYNQLMHHIRDMQKLTKKLDEFYAIVRFVTIVQVIISCLSIMSCSFFIIQMCFMGWSNAPITFIRFCFGFVSVSFQLFMYCYAFNLVDTARSTLNFGLYSSNWTEMELKFQKTLLLAMRMNSAHKQDMKITPKLKVDLELFGKTIGLSYRIVSVLVNK